MKMEEAHGNRKIESPWTRNTRVKTEPGYNVLVKRPVRMTGYLNLFGGPL